MTVKQRRWSIWRGLFTAVRKMPTNSTDRKVGWHNVPIQEMESYISSLWIRGSGAAEAARSVNKHSICSSQHSFLGVDTSFFSVLPSMLFTRTRAVQKAQSRQEAISTIPRRANPLCSNLVRAREGRKEIEERYATISTITSISSPLLKKTVRAADCSLHSILNYENSRSRNQGFDFF